jgi:hypothetical protein
MRREQKPKEVYEVMWLGKNPTYQYSKTFHSVNEATSFASTVKDSLVYHLQSSSKKSNSSKYRLIETSDAKEFIKSIRLHRKLREKSGFLNIDGEAGVTTTTEFRNSQKARAITVLVIAPILMYAGWKAKDSEGGKSLGYATMIIGGLIGVNTAKTYLINRKAN